MYFSIQNELKLAYGKVNLKEFSGGNTPGPPQKGRERGETGKGRGKRRGVREKVREGEGGGRGRKGKEKEGSWRWGGKMVPPILNRNRRL